MDAYRLVSTLPARLKLVAGGAVNPGARTVVEGALPVIVVTKLDGRSAALNADRIERIERNETTSTCNVYFVDGGRLTVIEGYEELIREMDESKARVLARAFSIANQQEAATSQGPTLRVLPTEDDTP